MKIIVEHGDKLSISDEMHLLDNLPNQKYKRETFTVYDGETKCLTVKYLSEKLEKDRFMITIFWPVKYDKKKKADVVTAMRQSHVLLIGDKK